MLVPKPKRKYIYAVYAFARAADDFADELYIEGGKEKRLALLDEWNSKLRDCYDNKAYDPIFIALGATVKECKIPLELFENLLSAFRQDVEKKRYSSFEEVLKYCSNSAEPIGRIVLMIFGKHDDEMFHYSDRICTALQLTNFWQDVSVDLKKDRIYIPLDDMMKFDYNESKLLNEQSNEPFRRLIKFEVQRTEEIFEEGRGLFNLIEADEKLNKLNWELKLTWLGGKEILRRIRMLDYDVLRKRPELTLIDKLKLMTRAKFLA